MKKLVLFSFITPQALTNMLNYKYSKKLSQNLYFRQFMSDVYEQNMYDGDDKNDDDTNEDDKDDEDDEDDGG